MATFLIVLAVVVWLAFGVLAARMTLVDFECQFGHGRGPLGLALVSLVMGPLGLIPTVVMGQTPGLLKGALGLAPVKFRDDVILHNDRNALYEFMIRGVKGLPENKDYWSEKRGWNSTTNSFDDFDKYLDFKRGV